MRDRKNIKSTVFVSLVAQSDNLGDVVIRRQILEWLRSTNSSVVVLTAGMPSDYLAAFELDPSVRRVHSKFSFASLLARSSLRRTGVLILSPGPVHVDRGPKSLLRSTAGFFRVLAVRCAGGHVVGVGRALQGDLSSLAARVERAVSRLAHYYVVRDKASADFFGSHVDLAPDVAFARSTSSTSERGIVALSFRSDSAVSREALRGALGIIKERGYRPVLVTQVHRDDDQHNILAQELGVEALLWRDRSHSEQLLQVQEIYAAAVVVVSDRLHALVFGVQSLAHPIAVGASSSGKAARTLQGVVDVKYLDRQFHGLEAILDAAAQQSSRAKLARDREVSLDRLSKVAERFKGHISHPRSQN